MDQSINGFGNNETKKNKNSKVKKIRLAFLKQLTSKQLKLLEIR